MTQNPRLYLEYQAHSTTATPMKKAIQKVRELLEEITELLSPAPQPGLVPIPVRSREGHNPRQRRS